MHKPDTFLLNTKNASHNREYMRHIFHTFIKYEKHIDQHYMRYILRVR